MKILETQRFGKVQYNQEHLILFRDGMIGFGDLKEYILIESPQMPLVMWLQSTTDSEVAFPLLEPEMIKSGYSFSMNQADKSMVKIEDASITKTLIVLTIPDDIEAMTANFKAPVVFNITNSCAGQMILQDKALSVKESVYKKFMQLLSVTPRYEANDEFEPEWKSCNWKQLPEVELRV